MASCSLGASNVKLSKLGFCRARVGNLPQQNGIKAWSVRRQLQNAGATSKKALSIRCGSSLESEVATTRSEGSKKNKQSSLMSQLIPNSPEIQSLVREICDTTSIAEFELKLGGFRLYVTRDLTKKSEPLSLPAPVPAVASVPTAPVSASGSVQASESNGSVPTTSLAISKSAPSSGGIQSFLSRAADEGLIILQSPRVGFFRRSRTIKGKRTPPACKEKQEVKEGQALCYIEQLGGELPIESDVSGEVVKILREDGEPVGYGDALIAILPSFPGIKKLQ